MSTSDMPTALVDEVYTYGAPATHQQPFRNAARKDECFPGLRSYTENLIGVHKEIHQEDAAAMFTFYPHAWTNSVVLHKTGDSQFTPCRDHKEFGHPEWPQRAANVFAHWPIHKETPYTERLRNVTVHGKMVATQEPFASANLFVALAWQAYEELETQKRTLREKMPGWKVVERQEDVHGGDVDPVTVVQNSKTLDCALVFTGTNSVSEFSTSTTQYGTGYCGFTGVHVGYRNELWTISNNKWHEIRPKLEMCGRVICVGHSLGGSLCEIFAACANSGNYSDPDYQLIAWKKGRARRMREI